MYTPTGGVKTMREFIIDILQQQGYQVSVAYYKPYGVDPQLSVPMWQLLSKKPSFRCTNGNVTEYELGARLPEFEFMRYKHNDFWQKIMDEHECFVSVSGYCLAAYPFMSTKRKYVGWFATTFEDDRVGRKESFARQLIEKINTPICLKLEKQILSDTHSKIFPLSQYTKNLFQKIVGSDFAFDTLAMPIDTSVFCPHGEKEPLSIVLAGRFTDARKNFALALKTIHYLVHEKGQNVKLYAIGDSPTTDVKNMISNLKIENNIVIIEYVTREELATYYQRSKVFLLTSVQEGLGIVIFEAMSCGVVPVITKCGGPEYIIDNDENGYKADFAPQQLGEYVHQLLTKNQLYQRLQNNCYQTIQQHFSYEKIKEKFLNQL